MTLLLFVWCLAQPLTYDSSTFILEVELMNVYSKGHLKIILNQRLNTGVNAAWCWAAWSK
jgi:hypothetical protein